MEQYVKLLVDALSLFYQNDAEALFSDRLVHVYFQARFGKDSNRNGKLDVSARCRIMQKTPSRGKLEGVFCCR